MPRDLDHDERERLEDMMDTCSVQSVLMALSEICGLKAEYVSHNWQDRNLAKAWATLEGAIGVIVPKAEGL